MYKNVKYIRKGIHKVSNKEQKIQERQWIKKDTRITTDEERIKKIQEEKEKGKKQST